MLITSSRKPSAKTRILCKQLASFVNCEYVNRGKMSMHEVLHLADGEPFLIVGEYHGNPGSLAIFDAQGSCPLSVHITAVFPAGFKPARLKKVEPVIVGRGKLADAIAASLPFVHVTDIHHSRRIMVDDEKMDLIDSGKLLFRFRIKSTRIDHEGGLG